MSTGIESDSGPRPAVLVMAAAPADELSAVLLRRTAAWAVQTGEAWLATTPGDVAGCVPAGMRVIAQRGVDVGARLAAAVGDVLGEGERPLLVVGARFARLGHAHAAAALSDLSAGADIAVGPALDGGYYLLAMTRAHPDLFALAPDAWDTRHVMELTLEAAGRAGLEVGMLRPERRLVTREDERAARLDPLTPPDVAALLAPA